MARVYGRVQVQGTQSAFRGEILFEPVSLGYVVDNVLYANFAYREVMGEEGQFEVDVFPGDYFVHLADATLEVTVPPVNEVTLRELLKVRYDR